MKYIRKITVYLISVIILASLVIGCGVIFAVKNINITIMGFSGGAEKSIAKVKTKLLSEFRGSVMLFVSEKEVAGAVDDGAYVVLECKKVYPCTLNVTLKERVETYYSENGEGYCVYDDSGIITRTVAEYGDTLNRFDGAPNIKISGAESLEDYKTVASVGLEFKEKFLSLRAVVSEISIRNAKSEYENDRIIFLLKCGLKIEVQDYSSGLKEKISAAYSQFGNLSGAQKLKGTVTSYSLLDGSVRAIYDPN